MDSILSPNPRREPRLSDVPLGVLFGALIVGVFTLGLRLLGADAQWTFLLIGLLIIAAVAVDQWIRKVAA